MSDLSMTVAASDIPRTTEFRPGDVLEWRRREGDYIAKRTVQFIEHRSGQTAVVSFGQERWTAPVGELSRPEPVNHRPSWVGPPVRMWKPPEPPTIGQIETK